MRAQPKEIGSEVTPHRKPASPEKLHSLTHEPQNDDIVNMVFYFVVEAAQLCHELFPSRKGTSNLVGQWIQVSGIKVIVEW
jgi:hypothetical protein